MEYGNWNIKLKQANIIKTKLKVPLFLEWNMLKYFSSVNDYENWKQVTINVIIITN